MVCSQSLNEGSLGGKIPNKGSALTSYKSQCQGVHFEFALDVCQLRTWSSLFLSFAMFIYQYFRLYSLALSST